MDISGMRSDIHMILEHHTNAASSIVNEERDYLRPWRRKFRDILVTKNEDMLGFLEKPLVEWPAETRHSDFFRTIRSLPAGSEWMRTHVTEIVNTDTVLSEIESDLGCSLKSVRSNIHSIMEKYLSTVRTLFEHNEKLDTNLQKLEDLHKRLSELPNMDPTIRSSAQLEQSILAYIDDCYKSWGIQQEYEAFCKTYAEFTAYRSILLPLQAAADTRGSPVCTICTTERITIALNPCGHVFCNSCGQKQRNQCYICRCSVSNRLRIYFS